MARKGNSGKQGSLWKAITGGSTRSSGSGQSRAGQSTGRPSKQHTQKTHGTDRRQGGPRK